MNRRMKKKQWKEQTTAKQADLQERVEALEELTRNMAAEQTAQRERIATVSHDLMLYKAAQRRRQEKAAEAKEQRERSRQERENARRVRNRNIRDGVIVTVAVVGIIFAVMLPAPDVTEPVPTVEPMVVMAEPAEGVVEAVALSWEG